MAGTRHRGNPDRPWAQQTAGQREARQIPLPNIDELPEQAEEMTTWGLTQKFRMGDVEVRSVHDEGFDPESWVGGKDSTAYDPTTIYTRATNRFDHAVTSTVRLPTEVDMLMGELVNRVPLFRNKSEFLRDAVIHALWRWEDMMRDQDRDWMRRLHLEVIRCHQDRIDVETRQWGEIIRHAEEIMEHQAGNGDAIGLGASLDFHEAFGEKSPEPWRSKVLDLCDRYRRRAKGMG